MRTWITALLLAAPLFASAVDNPNPMTAGDVTCPQYLAMPDNSPEKTQLQSWVAGRIAAIIPASFQPELRKISLPDFRRDIQDVCSSSDPEFTLFDISAMLAHHYQQEHRK